MNTTKYLGLTLHGTSSEDVATSFGDWRQAINGEEGSNMILIDDALGLLRAQLPQYGTAIIDTQSGEIVTATDAVQQKVISAVTTFSPVQGGEGDASSENVRPISGINSLNLTRTGKNLWGGVQLVETLTQQIPSAKVYEETKTICYRASVMNSVVFFNRFKPATQYTIVFKRDADLSGGTTANCRLFYTDNKNTMNISFSTYGNPTHIVSKANKSVSRIIGYNFGGDTYLYYDECGIFEGVVALDDFVPYEGITATIEFPNTVYGGSYNWVTGELIVSHGCIESYAGETVPDGWISSTGALDEGAQIVYPLEEPQTIQLKPKQIEMLAGYNTIWSDTGITTISYAKDTQTYIDSQFSEIEQAIISLGGNV